MYRNYIFSAIGELSTDRVTGLDVLGIIRKINESGGPAIANDALHYCKQVSNHGIKLGLLQTNPSLAFSIKDAGRIEQSRDRADVLTSENYLSMAILLILGVRKEGINCCHLG